MIVSFPTAIILLVDLIITAMFFIAWKDDPLEERIVMCLAIFIIIPAIIVAIGSSIFG